MSLFEAVSFLEVWKVGYMDQKSTCDMTIKSIYYKVFPIRIGKLLFWSAQNTLRIASKAQEQFQGRELAVYI